MIHKSDAATSFLHFLGGLLLTAVGVPVLCLTFLFAGFALAPVIHKAENSRDFDRAAWLATDGMQAQDPRGYMLGDVGDFLDEHPTKAEVIALLGPSDDGYTEVSYWVGFQHSFMPLDPYTLEISFEGGRVSGYHLAQH